MYITIQKIWKFFKWASHSYIEYLCQSRFSSIIWNTFICCIYFLNEFTLRVSVTLRNSVRHVMLLCRRIMLFMFTRKTSVVATTIDALHRTVRLNAACWVCRQVLTSARLSDFKILFFDQIHRSRSQNGLQLSWSSPVSSSASQYAIWASADVQPWSNSSVYDATSKSGHGSSPSIESREIF